MSIKKPLEKYSDGRIGRCSPWKIVPGAVVEETASHKSLAISRCSDNARG